MGFRLVALCLAVLGFSPLTAPFATFSFGDSAQSGTPGALKTAEPTKTGLDKLVLLPDLLTRSAEMRLVWIVRSLSRSALYTPAPLHVVLRI